MLNKSIFTNCRISDGESYFHKTLAVTLFVSYFFSSLAVKILFVKYNRKTQTSTLTVIIPSERTAETKQDWLKEELILDCGIELTDLTLATILDWTLTKLTGNYLLYIWLYFIYASLYSALTSLQLLIARFMLLLSFSRYYPFTNTISTDKTYLTAESKGGLILLHTHKNVIL